MMNNSHDQEGLMNKLIKKKQAKKVTLMGINTSDLGRINA